MFGLSGGQLKFNNEIKTEQSMRALALDRG